jgi:hypothetical protein
MMMPTISASPRYWQRNDGSRKRNAFAFTIGDW